MLKISEYVKGLTPLHIVFLKHCIQTKNYKIALKVVEVQIMSIPKQFEIDDKNIQNYFFYAAYVYTTVEVLTTITTRA